jgi:very-short-patch-repair endonuclease
LKEKSLQKVRKNLQRNPTIWETMFRKKLKQWGLRYQFQKIVCGFIPDFILPEYDLIVEIDGSQHYTQWGLIRDQYRDAVLNGAGFSVLHIRNTEVKDYQREDLINFAENLVLKPPDSSHDFFNTYLKSLK